MGVIKFFLALSILIHNSLDLGFVTGWQQWVPPIYSPRKIGHQAILLAPQDLMVINWS